MSVFTNFNSSPEVRQFLANLAGARSSISSSYNAALSMAWAVRANVQNK
jgi:hypothetical protein